jgi:very-short-patch-repair endonuclease
MTKDLYLNLLKGIRKKLRKNETVSEKILWKKIRKMKLGYKFRRQVSIGYYVVDFYCKDLSLAVEVDGSIHNLEHIKNRDRFRQALLETKGINFIRFSNKQVIQEMPFVLKTIKNTCDYLRTNAPPQRGAPEP